MKRMRNVRINLTADKNERRVRKMFENNPNTPAGWLCIGDDKVRYALGEPGSYNLVVIDLNPSSVTTGLSMEF